MSWLLILTITYHTPHGDRIKFDTVDGFQTEKACVAYLSQEDKWLKKIKRQTNIKEFDLQCVKGE